MVICIRNVLKPDELLNIQSAIAKSAFVDGKSTAGWHAALVKNNQQAISGQECIAEAEAQVSHSLLQNGLFRLAARPKQISRLLFSKYNAGMSYGSHVDDALMGNVRTDLSFTVFLNNPSDYDGGELVLDLHHAEQEFKLDAGDMVLYPSTTLHRVAPVSKGERLVTVGWAQSQIRRSDQRELLFDLETARISLFEKEGKSQEFDLLSKSLANLLRMWAE
jgi:PKHD-type hydroxylase